MTFATVVFVMQVRLDLDAATFQALERYLQAHPDQSEPDALQKALKMFLEREGYLRALPKSVGMARSGLADLAEQDETLL
jgi:aminoglycoside phosphotransferase family enzyme